MIQFREKLKGSPAYARVAPFVIFLFLTSAPSFFGDSTRFWFYVAKTFVGAWLVWEMRPFVAEMRWAFSWEAVAVGIGVFFMWVFLDPFYPQAKAPSVVWNPFAEFGESSGTAWLFAGIRILGMTIVVPPLEEAFYRSFLYRYFVRINFLEMPLSRFHFTSFLVTAVIFGVSHQQWLAGILCGFAYQWLALRKNRLGDSMTAHAITNFMLGVWVVWKGDWKFF
ncbi:MAG: CAAX prenyl protease-related protein [Verrucomicrobiota bacterium]